MLLFDALYRAEQALPLAELARQAGLPKTSTHRLAEELCRHALLERTELGYRLGLHLFELGQLAQQRLRLREVALPLLEELRQVTGHTVHLGVLDGADVVYAERLETAECRRIMATVPRRFPSHCTSSGKVIAAFNPALPGNGACVAARNSTCWGVPFTGCSTR